MSDPIREAIDTLAARIAELVADRLAAGGPRDMYDSLHLPPRVSRRRFAEVCRSGRVADALRDGRNWTCTRRAWEAARKARADCGDGVTTSLDAKADALLTRAGLRVVR
jgi:hypothetical protein